MTLKLLSPAKINLFLHILGQQADGYHQLQTLFQLLNYGDVMGFRLRTDSECRIQQPISGINEEDNLIIKAARSLQKATGCQSGADISIDKRLPIGGGLGGGSSNAASTLVALNHLWKTRLGAKQLSRIGVALGADVPVFIQGRTAWAEGIGEQLQAVDLPEYWYLIIKPDCGISTRAVFSREELTRDTPAITVAAFLEQGGRNDCEETVCSIYPSVKMVLNWLRQFTTAQLTGTGSCVFSSFPTEDEARAVSQEVPGHWECFVARGINRSPIQSLLQ